MSVALAVYCGVASTPAFGQCTHPLFWNNTESYATANSPVAIAVGDLNNDTFVDLAIAARFGNAISILLNRGDGTFDPQVSTPKKSAAARPAQCVLRNFAHGMCLSRSGAGSRPCSKMMRRTLDRDATAPSFESSPTSLLYPQR